MHVEATKHEILRSRAHETDVESNAEAPLAETSQDAQGRRMPVQDFFSQPPSRTQRRNPKIFEAIETGLRRAYGDSSLVFLIRVQCLLAL
jgi:hypothetical protein